MYVTIVKNTFFKFWLLFPQFRILQFINQGLQIWNLIIGKTDKRLSEKQTSLGKTYGTRKNRRQPEKSRCIQLNQLKTLYVNQMDIYAVGNGITLFLFTLSRRHFSFRKRNLHFNAPWRMFILVLFQCLCWNLWWNLW